MQTSWGADDGFAPLFMAERPAGMRKARHPQTTAVEQALQLLSERQKVMTSGTRNFRTEPARARAKPRWLGVPVRSALVLCSPPPGARSLPRGPCALATAAAPATTQAWAQVTTNSNNPNGLHKATGPGDPMATPTGCSP